MMESLRNRLHSLVLLGGMALLLGAVAWALGGGTLVLWGAAAVVVLLAVSPRVPPAWLLRLYGARPLAPWEAPRLHAVLETLARRAGLTAVPALYYLPSRLMNAFSVGRRDDAGIAVTDGLLRGLTLREVAAVLAHELSHIRHDDTWVMGLADLVSRVTAALSLLGQLLVLVNLPLFVFGRATFPWLAAGLLVAAPLLSALLQLALSRQRELDADLGASRISDDPEALASALTRLERQEEGWARLLLPGRRSPEPSPLRSHPRTEERVERLLALARRHGAPPVAATGDLRLPEHIPAVRRPPRRHPSGLWY